MICFNAIAPNQSNVSVLLSGQTIPLIPQSQILLPENSGVLTNNSQPIDSGSINRDRQFNSVYQGCTRVNISGDLGQPEYRLTLNNQTISQTAPGQISILSPLQFNIAEVTAESGTTRTGPSSDYSRLTPLPKGTQAVITGREGDWLRLDYGAWIKSQETRSFSSAIPLRSIIRGVTSRQVDGATEILFPLEVPVPVAISQGTNTFTLTLYDTIAQTDIIRLNDDPLISRLDWHQIAPETIEYKFNLKTAQQWGYHLEYRGTTLVLSLRHPPKIQLDQKSSLPLSGIRIVIDPGHGGPEDLGGVGPTGEREKQFTLIISKLVRDRLLAKGATVYMTRETDVDLDLPPRVALIEKQQPAIAISFHYNALPDQGDVFHTKGVGAFWYQPQAHSLAVFLHNYLIQKLGRPDYGVFWDNLALTRPAIAPSILLELGFMTNPFEFEWVKDPQAQQQLADAIAEGITLWFTQVL